MHEVFLCRVAAHPILRKDLNFHVFLEYNQDVSVRLMRAAVEVVAAVCYFCKGLEGGGGALSWPSWA